MPFVVGTAGVFGRRGFTVEVTAVAKTAFGNFEIRPIFLTGLNVVHELRTASKPLQTAHENAHFTELTSSGVVEHHGDMNTLGDIEKAAEKLSAPQKRELIRFLNGLLGAESTGPALRNLPPAERAEDLKRWAAGHERGSGLPNSAAGRDTTY
jgi:hypothetical protein